MKAKDNIDVLAIGELLIDFTPVKTASDKTCYEQNPGGAPANVLAMASRLGANTAFVGKVGRDKFGDYLLSVLNKDNINTQGVVFSEDVTTTLAFVHLDERGERSFSFCRNPGADILLEEKEIDYDLIDSSQIFHFGSLSFTDEPSKTAVIRAASYAKKNGNIVSYDPNYRRALWKSDDAAIEGMGIGLEYADIVKLSEEEAELLTGQKDIGKAAKTLIQKGIKLVLITLGEKGSYFAHASGTGIVKGVKVECVDTTGAGDAFMGSMLYQLSKKGYNLEDIETDALTDMLKYANTCAALCVGERGGIPSMPTLDKINRFLKSR